MSASWLLLLVLAVNCQDIPSESPTSTESAITTSNTIAGEQTTLSSHMESTTATPNQQQVANRGQNITSHNKGGLHKTKFNFNGTSSQNGPVNIGNYNEGGIHETTFNF